ncbi:endolytic transglycosylase MltG [Schinkia sp. CFF1]
MDKHTARGLAIGLFFTAIILLVFKPAFALDKETVTSYLEENNLMVISKEEPVNIEQSDHSATKENDSSEYDHSQMAMDNEKDMEQQVPKDDQQFNITKGMVSSDVAYQLKKNGLIKNQAQFIKTLRSKNGEKYIQIGEYKLNSSMSNDEIISVLTRNRV